MTPGQEYDFAAADELVGALRYLHQKITDLRGLRKKLRDTDLDCVDRPGVSMPWRGQRRNRFDADFDRQQAQLDHLAAEANRVLKAVNAATDDAHQSVRAHARQHIG